MNAGRVPAVRWADDGGRGCARRRWWCWRGTGSAPRWWRRRGASWTRWHRTTTSRSLGPSTWSAASRSTRTARPSRTRCSTRAAARTRCSSAPSAARSGTPPTPTSRAPSRGSSASARASASTPTCGPSRPWPALYEASPLRRERIEGTDLLVVRELTGGLYFGEPAAASPTPPSTPASTAWRRSPASPRSASPRAQGRREKVTSVDKANVLETSRLWREQVTETAKGHPDIELEHMLVDNARHATGAAAPADFDVIVTENLFGDILSDEAAMITGSIGMLPSAPASAPAPSACTSPSTARRPTSPARASRTRSRRCCRRR